MYVWSNHRMGSCSISMGSGRWKGYRAHDVVWVPKTSWVNLGAQGKYYPLVAYTVKKPVRPGVAECPDSNNRNIHWFHKIWVEEKKSSWRFNNKEIRLLRLFFSVVSFFISPHIWSFILFQILLLVPSSFNTETSAMTAGNKTLCSSKPATVKYKKCICLRCKSGVVLYVESKYIRYIKLQINN